MSCRRTFLDGARPLRPLLASAINRIEANLRSESLPNVSWRGFDPVEMQRIYEEVDCVLFDECFGAAFYTIPFGGHLASPVAISMGISDLAERECKTLYLCRTATEMDVTMVLLEQVTGADIDRVQAGQLSDDEWDRLVLWLNRLDNFEFSVLQIPSLSIPALHEWFRVTAKGATRRPFVVIDDETLISRNRKANIEALIKLSKTYEAAIAVVAPLWHH